MIPKTGTCFGSRVTQEIDFQLYHVTYQMKGLNGTILGMFYHNFNK